MVEAGHHLIEVELGDILGIFVPKNAENFAGCGLKRYALFVRHHFRNARNRRVAGIEIALRVHRQEVGFHKLAFPGAAPVAHRAQDIAVLIDVDELAVIAGRHPKIAVAIEMHRAGQVLHG